jgi:hypothetical protein
LKEAFVLTFGGAFFQIEDEEERILTLVARYRRRRRRTYRRRRNHFFTAPRGLFTIGESLASGLGFLNNFCES